MKFRKKPVVIEARRYIGVPTMPGNQPVHTWDAYAAELEEWLQSEGERLEPTGNWGREDEDGKYTVDAWDLLVPTLHGQATLRVGDYLVRGERDFWPVDAEQFESTYELVEKETTNG